MRRHARKVFLFLLQMPCAFFLLPHHAMSWQHSSGVDGYQKIFKHAKDFHRKYILRFIGTGALHNCCDTAQSSCSFKSRFMKAKLAWQNNDSNLFHFSSIIRGAGGEMFLPKRSSMCRLCYQFGTEERFVLK